MSRRDYTIILPWPASMMGAGGSLRSVHSNRSIFSRVSMRSPREGGKRMRGLDEKSRVLRAPISPMLHGRLCSLLAAKVSLLRFCRLQSDSGRATRSFALRDKDLRAAHLPRASGSLRKLLFLRLSSASRVSLLTALGTERTRLSPHSIFSRVTSSQIASGRSARWLCATLMRVRLT